MSKRQAKHRPKGAGNAASSATTFRVKRSLLAILPLAFGVWLPVQAIGLGSAQLGSHLGQPLFLEVPVHGLDGEDRASRCIRADVGSIDGNLLIRGRTQLLTKGEANWLQVRTGQLINEPIITLAVAIGCDAPVRRDYQILLDLPGTSEPAVPALLQATVAKESAAQKQLAQKSANTTPAGNNTETQRFTQAQSQPEKKAFKDSRDFSQAVSDSTKERSSRKRDTGVGAGKGQGAYVPASFAPFSLRLSMTLTLPPEGLMAPMAPAVPALAMATAMESESSVSKSQIIPKAESEAGPATGVGVVLASTRQPGSVSTVQNQDLQTANQSLLRWTQGLGAALLASLGALVWVHRRMRRENSLLAAELEADMDSRDRVADADAGLSAEARAKLHGTTRAVKPFTQSAHSFQSDQSTVDPTVSPLESVASAEFVESADAIDEAEEFEWEGSLAGQAGKGPLASNFHRQLVDMVSPEEVDDLVQLAESWLALNKPEAVIEILGPMNKVEAPESPLPWLYLLNAYRQVGDRKSFDDLYGRVKAHFNVDVPDWSAREVAAPTTAQVLADYSHITDNILAAWNSDEIVPYLESLLPDDRSGNRQGFPLRVYEDILALIHLAGDPKRAIDPTGSVPEEVLEIIYRGESASAILAAQNSGRIQDEKPADRKVSAIFPELQIEALEPAPTEFSFTGISRRA